MSDNVPDGAEPLPDTRLESFAQLRAAGGVTRVGAWIETLPPRARKITRDSAKTLACRAEARPEVAARIAFLRHARAAELKPVSLSEPAALPRLMAELSDALRQVYDRLGAEGADESALSRVRKAMTAHAGRTLSRRELTEAPAEAATGISIPDVIERGRDWHKRRCKCPV